jgi:hypothetical protein
VKASFPARLSLSNSAHSANALPSSKEKKSSFGGEKGQSPEKTIQVQTVFLTLQIHQITRIICSVKQ